MSNSTDAKITFREFSLGITPELNGLSTETVGVDFNLDQKKKAQHEHMLKSLNRVNR
jgi:hypothetical protein